MPHALVGQEIDARITHHAVELLHRGQRIACRARSERRGEFITATAHIGPACALEEQLRQPEAAAMSFEERLTLLVDREIHYRNDRKRTGAAAGRIMLGGIAELADVCGQLMPPARQAVLRGLGARLQQCQASYAAERKRTGAAAFRLLVALGSPRRITRAHATVLVRRVRCRGVHCR